MISIVKCTLGVLAVLQGLFVVYTMLFHNDNDLLCIKRILIYLVFMIQFYMY